MPKQSCRDGFFPCFPPLLWDGHTHTLLSFQACWEHSICKAVPWPAKRKKEWLQSWYSLVMCWHSAPENEAWGSSKCREMPHCYPSSHGTRACNPVINGILPWGTEGLSDLILVLFWILSLIQAAWRALTEFGGGQDNFSTNIPLPQDQCLWERSWRGFIWVVAKCSVHSSFPPPARLPHSPKTCFEHRMTLWLSELSDWWLQTPASTEGPWPHQGTPASLSAWCQGTELTTFCFSAASIKGKSPVTTFITSQFQWIGTAAAQGQKSHPMGRAISWREYW